MVDTERVRRVRVIPLEYVAAVALAVLLGAGIYLLRSSDRSAPARDPRGLAAGGAQTSLSSIGQICVEARQRIAALPQPNRQDPTNAATIAYAEQAFRLSNEALKRAEAIARSDAYLAQAFAVEARGQQVVGQEIPALEQHDLSRAEQLASNARQLTAVADAAIRSAGLGVCVGS